MVMRLTQRAHFATMEAVRRLALSSLRAGAPGGAACLSARGAPLWVKGMQTMTKQQVSP
jgi:hypothetical protein